MLVCNAGSCYSTALRDNHPCVENAMKNSCPLCCEYLFDSMEWTAVLRCGHTIHKECFSQMLDQKLYRCPICSKSTVDMSMSWQRLDDVIAATTMPDDYQFEVQIFCNDCGSTTQVKFHIDGHKCSQCGSYNTRKE